MIETINPIPKRSLFQIDNIMAMKYITYYSIANNHSKCLSLPVWRHIGAWSRCSLPVGCWFKNTCLPSHSLVRHPLGDVSQFPVSSKFIPNELAASLQSCSLVKIWLPCGQILLPRSPLLIFLLLSTRSKNQWNSSFN